MRLVGTFIVLSAVASASPISAIADTIVALRPNNVLIKFDSTTPVTVTSSPITGMEANQTARGIDVRPATGEVIISAVTSLSASDSPVTTYKLDVNSAVATLIGVSGIPLAGAGDVDTGYDFNPRADRIRYVNTNDENARFNPNNGALAGNDTDITPAIGSTIIAAAYDRISLESTQTTMYVINRATSQLGIQGGVNGTPNTGAIVDVLDLGIVLNAADDGGLDITSSGLAYAGLSDIGSGVTGLYTINLAVGGGPATFVGPIGSGTVEVYSLAALLPDTDTDGKFDVTDNCPAAANADQADQDADGEGDTCDSDVDGNNLPDAITPDTTITTAPVSSKSKKATLEFTSSLTGATFECALDVEGYKTCASPKTYNKLKTGKRTVKVRALGSEGIVDLTPATAEWTVKKNTKKKKGKGKN